MKSIRQYSLGFTILKDGIKVLNYKTWTEGHHKEIAFISLNRSVLFTDEEMPEMVREEIQTVADTVVFDPVILNHEEMSSLVLTPYYFMVNEIPDRQKGFFIILAQSISEARKKAQEMNLDWTAIYPADSFRHVRGQFPCFHTFLALNPKKNSGSKMQEYTVSLPIYVGQEFYLPSRGEINPFFVLCIYLYAERTDFTVQYCGPEEQKGNWTIRFQLGDIGESIFLTKEEAEEALEEA